MEKDVDNKDDGNQSNKMSITKQQRWLREKLIQNKWAS